MVFQNPIFKLLNHRELKQENLDQIPTEEGNAGHQEKEEGNAEEGTQGLKHTGLPESIH